MIYVCLFLPTVLISKFMKQVFEEKAYLVGVARKGDTDGSFGIEESLNELEQLADTAGLSVVGSTYQK